MKAIGFQVVADAKDFRKSDIADVLSMKGDQFKLRNCLFQPTAKPLFVTPLDLPRRLVIVQPPNAAEANVISRLGPLPELKEEILPTTVLTIDIIPHPRS